MNYKKEKLNISIENSNYFDEIRENDGYVSLIVSGVEEFKIYSNSTVIAYSNSTVIAWDNSTVIAYSNSTVIAYSNSTVKAYGNSTVKACEFSCVYIKSTKAKVSTENHFGAIIKQVFKTTKKAIVYKKLQNNRIAVLELEKGQVFQSENHDKCRTDHAKVLRIESVDGKTQFQDGTSQQDSNFKYIVGETVSAEYDKTIKECSTGIHFFLTREKAERY